MRTHQPQQEDAKEPELESLMLKAEQEDADAQYNLGKMYKRGDGFNLNYAEAARLWRLAAAQGHKSAIRFLPGLENMILNDAKAKEEAAASPLGGGKSRRRRTNKKSRKGCKMRRNYK
jgi:TPR repeat protein